MVKISDTYDKKGKNHRNAGDSGKLACMDCVKFFTKSAAALPE